jgi:hypothetical protein
MTQLSHSITNIYTTPLCFGISAYNTSCLVEIVSFLLLRKSIVDNNVSCSWGGEEEDDIFSETSSDSSRVDSDEDFDDKQSNR